MAPKQNRADVQLTASSVLLNPASDMVVYLKAESDGSVPFIK